MLVLVLCHATTAEVGFSLSRTRQFAISAHATTTMRRAACACALEGEGVAPDSQAAVNRYPRPVTVAMAFAPSTLRNVEICTDKLFSSTTRSFHARSNSSLLVTTRSRRSIKASNTSNARDPIWHSTPSASRTRSSVRNSNGANRKFVVTGLSGLYRVGATVSRGEFPTVN